MSYYDDASLVVIPSGYKTSKVYAEKPTDGSGDLAFTRTGDTATRVNSAGLIEKVRTNVATYSEDFSNAAWNKYQANITANSVVAPNGTTTADTITDNAVNDVHIAYQSISFPAGEYSVSCYAKANTLGHAFLQIYNGTSFYVSGIFNLTNGTVSGAGSITSVGNGWYRLSFTAQITAGVGFAYVGTSNGSSVAYVGTGQSIYIWGYQAETGVATPYIPTLTAAVSTGPTANVPRLDYLGSTCGKLLLEPQRTNLATYSEQFNNAAWLKINTTATANVVTSPDGYTNADKIIPANGNNIAVVYQSIIPAGTSTASIYAKAGEFGGIVIATGTTGAFFNLTTGQYRTAYNAAPTAYSITSVGNGWYRCSVTLTSAADNLYIGANDNVSNDLTVTGNGTSGIFVWGAQLEAGAYATSYIPTLAASATRGADACSKTSISSLIGQTEGTLFVDFTINGLANFGTPISVNNGTSLQSIWLTIFANGNLRAELYNGATQASITYSGAVVGGRYKMAFGYKTNDFVLYVNGAQVGTDNSGTTFSGTTLSRVDTDLANASVYSTASESINQALLFTTRLTNAALAELTTL